MLLKTEIVKLKRLYSGILKSYSSRKEIVINAIKCTPYRGES